MKISIKQLAFILIIIVSGQTYAMSRLKLFNTGRNIFSAGKIAAKYTFSSMKTPLECSKMFSNVGRSLAASFTKLLVYRTACSGILGISLAIPAIGASCIETKGLLLTAAKVSIFENQHIVQDAAYYRTHYKDGNGCWFSMHGGGSISNPCPEHELIKNHLNSADFSPGEEIFTFYSQDHKPLGYLSSSYKGEWALDPRCKSLAMRAKIGHCLKRGRAIWFYDSQNNCIEISPYHQGSAEYFSKNFVDTISKRIDLTHLEKLEDGSVRGFWWSIPDVVKKASGINSKGEIHFTKT